MRLYKLTDQDNKTRTGHANETVWGPGVSHTAEIEGTELCTNQVIHAYTDPMVAVLMNPVHANIYKPVMWIAEGHIVAETSDKCGVKILTTLRQRRLPKVTLNQAVAFGILCALDVYEEPSFVKWANGWLAGKDRTAYAAYAARAAAEAAAATAVYVAARAAYAAYAAADAAAYAAAEAAEAAEAAYAAAAEAARAAAEAAAYVAEAAARAIAVGRSLNLAQLAKESKKYA